MSKQQSLSIVIPIKNMAGRLANLFQTIEPALELGHEVILILDGCEDATESEIRDYFCESFQRVILVKTQGVGPGIARNIGMSKVTKDWVAFWDSDDVGYPRTVNELLKCKNLSETDVIIGRFGTVLESREVLSDSLVEILPAEATAVSSLNPGIWRMIFRRSLLKTIEFGVSNLGEDQVFLARVLNCNPRIEFVDEQFYSYFKGNEQQITSKPVNRDSLRVSIRESLDCLSQAESRFIKAQYVLVLRMIGTLLKRSWGSSNFRTLALGCLQYMFEILRRPNRVIFSAMLTILDDSRNRKRVNHLHLTGGLGNQLFQIAAAKQMTTNRKLKIDVNSGNPRQNLQGVADFLEFDFPAVYFEIEKTKFSSVTKKGISFCLRRNLSHQEQTMGLMVRKLAELVTSTLLSVYYKRVTIVRVCKGLGYDEFLHQSRFDSYFVGYFQSCRWLETSFTEKSKFLELSKFPPSLLEYKGISEVEKPLVVHLRLGDYLVEDGFGTPSSEYYREAISLAVSQGQFKKIWLFSDEPEVAVNRMPTNLPLEIRVMPNFQNSSALTLEAMRLGHGYVIANSTFSWWAAMLSHSKDSMVFYPYPWFKSLDMPKDLIPRQRFQAVSG